MSRQVDTTKPLSDEDRRYLLERGHEQTVAYIDSLHAEDAPEDPEDLDHGPDFPEFQDPALAAAQARVTGDAADASGDSDAEEPDADRYDEMNKAALKEELADRRLPTSGTADEMRDRLRKADEQA